MRRTRGSEDKAAARATAIAEKKCTAEEFDEAVRATGDAYYEKLAANLVAALESLQSLETLSDEKFGREAPSFANLRTALEELQDLVKQYHKPARRSDGGAPAEAQAEEAVEESRAAPAASGAPAAKKKSVTAEPADRDDAMQRLAVVAHFLRHESPLNPVPYLLLRAMRWGELRAAGATLNPAIARSSANGKAHADQENVHGRGLGWSFGKLGTSHEPAVRQRLARFAALCRARVRISRLGLRTRGRRHSLGIESAARRLS